MKMAALQDHTTVQIPKDDPIRKDIQKMPIRKGSLLIWNSRLPHGTYQNYSNRFRMIQYMKMGRNDDPAIEPVCIGLDDFEVNQSDQLNDLGLKLFGYKEWNEEDVIIWKSERYKSDNNNNQK
jgi:hypothetical protein